MRKVDLAGHIFGKLTVLEDSGQRDNAGHVIWKCRCECGNEVFRTTKQLKKTHLHSCGQCGPDDLTGRIIYYLTVLYYRSDVRKWHCRCVCGNECDESAAMLNSGRVRSCGCKSVQPRDLTGMKFGMWTVLEKCSGKGATKYLCRCECGTERVLPYNNLAYGRSTSCGKHRGKEHQDLTGMKFGMWTVLEKYSGEGKTNYLCRCDCGTEKVIPYTNLIYGRSTSCGRHRRNGRSDTSTLILTETQTTDYGDVELSLAGQDSVL